MKCKHCKREVSNSSRHYCASTGQTYNPSSDDSFLINLAISTSMFNSDYSSSPSTDSSWSGGGGDFGGGGSGSDF